MTDRLSESELLAYVEGELDASQVRRFRERLAGEGHILAALDRMREDRKLLRSAGEPVPPIDFLTELEPQLARPMLMGQPPGAYRRRHRRQRSTARLARWALAAVVLLAVSGAVWIAMTLGGSRLFGGAETELRAQGDAMSTEDGARAVVGDRTPPLHLADGDEGDWPPPGTVIVHERPLPAGPGSAVAMSAGAAQTPGEAPPPPAGLGAGSDITIVSAEFAVILPAADLASGERLLGEAVQALAATAPGPAEAPVALVRNFTEAEARVLIARYYDPMPGDPSAPDRIAGMDDARNDRPSWDDRARQRRWVSRMLRELRARHQAEDEEALFSTQLLGRDDLAASYERQLSFSGRGATHTITIPAASLPGMLTRLYQADGASTTLRLLPPEDEAVRVRPDARAERARGASPLHQWVDAHRRIRQFMTQLRDEQHRDAYVLLPVVIETQAEETPARR